MEKCRLDRYAFVETALNKAGFKVDGIEKQANKTVITVSHKKQGDAPRLLKKNGRGHLK